MSQSHRPIIFVRRPDLLLTLKTQDVKAERQL